MMRDKYIQRWRLGRKRNSECDNFYYDDICTKKYIGGENIGGKNKYIIINICSAVQKTVHKTVHESVHELQKIINT